MIANKSSEDSRKGGMTMSRKKKWFIVLVSVAVILFGLQWAWKYYSLPEWRKSCQGCVTVSTKGMSYLWTLINKEKKPLLLWNYESTKP